MPLFFQGVVEHDATIYRGEIYIWTVDEGQCVVRFPVLVPIVVVLQYELGYRVVVAERQADAGKRSGAIDKQRVVFLPDAVNGQRIDRYGGTQVSLLVKLCKGDTAAVVHAAGIVAGVQDGCQERDEPEEGEQVW